MKKDRLTMPQRAAYAMLRVLFRGISLLPFPILYFISDFFALFIGGIICYRRKVININLHHSFPDETEKNIRKIRRDFYRFLCDCFFETAKMSGISRKEIMSRMRFENLGEADRFLQEGRPVSLFLGHIGNWEWISSIPLHLSGRVAAGQIYHPLSNRPVDALYLWLRGRFGATSIPMDETLRTILRWHNAGITSICGYIADQAPGFNGIHLFLPFLNQETPVFTGPERISRKLHAAAFYIDVTRPRRGEYAARFVKIADDAADFPEFELTRRYYRLLEDNIRRNPSLWLWSHRRWKRTRADFMKFWGEEEGSRRLGRM